MQYVQRVRAGHMTPGSKAGIGLVAKSVVAMSAPILAWVVAELSVSPAASPPRADISATVAPPA